MLLLRQSTASQEILIGPFLSDSDGKTAQTSLTIANTDIKLWVSGATTLANKNSGGATHISAGLYYAVLDATDTATLGSGEVNVSVSGALPVRRPFTILPPAIYDSLVAGTDNLQVDAVEISGASSAADGVEANIGNLDAAVSSRSTYAGSDTSGTTTLLSLLTATRAGYLDNLSGGAVALASDLATTDAVADAIKLKTDNLPASFPSNFASLVISAGGLVSINTAQTLSAARALDAIADTSLTINDALHCAVAGAAGDESVVSTAYTIMTPSTNTVLRTFTLDSDTSPTSRT